MLILLLGCYKYTVCKAIQHCFVLFFVSGADMDVCLGQYGQCNFISAKHAFIFYDEVRKTMTAEFEILTFSS